MLAHIDYMSKLAYHELMAITSAELTICELSLTINKEETYLRTLVKGHYQLGSPL